MAGKGIEQKITLKGEQEYNRAIKEAQRNLKTLKSELKAETAELGKNATEQQKAETKAANLKKQIAEQEKVVKTLRAALQEVREKYGDNADECAKWEQKLNNARTTLANMKTDLEGVGSGFKTVNTDAAAATVATKSVADALGSIGSAGDSVSGAIENIFTGLIDTIRDTATELWDLITETASKANNWTDIANYWGTDAQTIQEYARAVKAAGNNFDDLQSAVTRMVLGGKGKKITELIGISDVNYKNDWDYAMAVMNEMYAMRESGKDMTPIYEEIFGAKKSTAVMDLLNDWDKIQELRAEFNGNETGYGMSDEELATMDDLYVKISTIEEKWTAIKDNFAAGFGLVSLDLLVNVEGTLDGIADYLNAGTDEEKQAALDKIRTNVEDFFTKLADVIRESLHILHDVGENLQGSDDPLTSAIGDILVKLSEALQWMVDNQEAVKGAFEAIFGMWLIAKLAAVAGKLAGILMQIETIKAFKGISVAAGASEAGTAAGTSWGASFGSAVMKAVPWLAGLLVFMQNAITPQGNDDLWDEEGNTTELGQSQGITQTKEEAEDEWRNSEEGKESILGGKGDRIEAAGFYTRKQYQTLNDLYRDYTGQENNHYSQEELYNLAKKQFGDDTEQFDQFIRKIYELSRSGGELPTDLPLEWFGVNGEEAEEEMDLDARREYTNEERDLAVQDWFDALKDWWSGNIDDDEYGSALDYFNEVFGEKQGDVMEAILQKLDEQKDQTKLDDIPMDWWMSLGGWNSGSGGGDNGVSNADLEEGFKGLPASLQAAAKNGVAAGVKGLRLEIDGQTAGKILAPYVSQEIAKDIP